VVRAFLADGHKVRALVRPSTEKKTLRWSGDVEVCSADLRVQQQLHLLFENIDVLVHLAAVVLGDDATHFASTLGGTERLLDAMALSKTRRLVLASTMSVYGWLESSRTLTEDTPPPKDLYESGAYAIAKTWQERITRRMSAAHNWDLTVLRPGFVWGPGNESLAIVGPRFKKFRFVIGPSRYPPLTFVDNCADLFLKAAKDPRAIGETFNVVDGGGPSAWRFAGEISRRTGAKERRIPVPYSLARVNALFADFCRRMVFKKGGKLPGLLRPRQLAYSRPLHFSNRKVVEKLEWKPPIDFDMALRLCFASQKDGSVADTSCQ
jgi:UDP-glucose 4-epimerase